MSCKCHRRNHKNNNGKNTNGNGTDLNLKKHAFLKSKQEKNHFNLNEITEEKSKYHENKINFILFKL